MRLRSFRVRLPPPIKGPVIDMAFGVPPGIEAGALLLFANGVENHSGPRALSSRFRCLDLGLRLSSSASRPLLRTDSVTIIPSGDRPGGLRPHGGSGRISRVPLP